MTNAELLGMLRWLAFEHPERLATRIVLRAQKLLDQRQPLTPEQRRWVVETYAAANARRPEGERFLPGHRKPAEVPKHAPAPDDGVDRAASEIRVYSLQTGALLRIEQRFSTRRERSVWDRNARRKDKAPIETTVEMESATTR